MTNFGSELENYNNSKDIDMASSYSTPPTKLQQIWKWAEVGLGARGNREKQSFDLSLIMGASLQKGRHASSNTNMMFHDLYKLW